MAQPSARQISQAFEAAIIKDKLELELRRQYLSWTNFVVSEFAIAILNGSTAGKVTADSIGMLAILLENHYKETTQAFTNFDLGFTKKQNNVVVSTENQIKKRISSLIASRLFEKTNEIIGTTEKLMALSIQAAVEGLQEENATITNEIVSVTAANIFRIRMEGRAIGISTTETTWPSEGARQINNRAVQEPLANTLQAQAEIALINGDTNNLALQAVDLAGLSSAESAKEAGILSLGVATGVKRVTVLPNAVNNVLNMVKTWVTMGDAKVRDSHRNSNGQTIPDPDPFQVGSSLLQYPADGSLGADISEIVNCRCFVAYR